jgi:DNA-binding NtrC family response regulator
LAAETVGDPPPGGGKTILVAEDEVLVRLDISEYLRARGYNVIEANSAAEAIQVLKNDLEVAAVFTDVRMPGTVDGIDLARYVQNHHPHIPVVITSGHVSPKEVPAALGPFIAKPYDRVKVLETIEQLLRQGEKK